MHGGGQNDRKLEAKVGLHQNGAPRQKWGPEPPRSATPAPSSDAMAAILMTTHCICIKEKLHVSTGGKYSHPQVYGASEGAFMYSSL